jgi:hypothetical protein
MMIITEEGLARPTDGKRRAKKTRGPAWTKPAGLKRDIRLQPRDLIPYIGSRNRVHEILNRRRELTLNMIRRLHEGLGIPAESLIKIGQQKAA